MSFILDCVPFSSVTQSYLTLCDPIDCSTPGFPVHYQLLEFIQTHVHRVRDAIQPSHHLSSPSPLTFNLSQHQGFSKESVLPIRGPNIGVSASASVLPINIQDWFLLGWTGFISLQSRDFQKSSPTPQFKSICPHVISLWAFYSVPLIYISVFVPIPYCLDDCGFVV